MKKNLILTIITLIILLGVTTPVYSDEIIKEETREEVPLINEEVIEEETREEVPMINEEVIEEEILPTNEELLNINSNDMEFIQDNLYIYGNINEKTITVLDILNNINIIELNNYFNNIDIKIISSDASILTNEDLINEGCYLFIISDNFISRYNIFIKYDYNNDSIINDIDIDYIIDNMFKEENTNTIEDITNVDYIINNNTFIKEENTNTDIINTTIDNYDNLYKDERVEIEYTIDATDITSNIAVSGEIEYDKDVVELESISIKEDYTYKGGSQYNNFLYLIENTNIDNITIIFKFKLINSGITNITINNINLSTNGYLLNIENTMSSNLTIKEYGIGGSVNIPTVNKPVIENKPPVVENKPTNKPAIIVVPNTNNNSNSNSNSNIVATTISLSNDTSIKELTIEGYDIEFNSNTYEYEITIPNDINNLNFNIIPNSDKASFFINGNESFNVGRNEVIITVQAEDGSTKDYVILINKEEEQIVATDNKEEENTEEEIISIPKKIIYIIIPIIIIILIIIDIIYINKHKEK